MVESVSKSVIRHRNPEKNPLRVREGDKVEWVIARRVLMLILSCVNLPMERWANVGLGLGERGECVVIRLLGE